MILAFLCNSRTKKVDSSMYSHRCYYALSAPPRTDEEICVCFHFVRVCFLTRDMRLNLRKPGLLPAKLWHRSLFTRCLGHLGPCISCIILSLIISLGSRSFIGFRLMHANRRNELSVHLRLTVLTMHHTSGLFCPNHLVVGHYKPVYFLADGH